MRKNRKYVVRRVAQSLNSFEISLPAWFVRENNLAGKTFSPAMSFLGRNIVFKRV